MPVPQPHIDPHFLEAGRPARQCAPMRPGVYPLHHVPFLALDRHSINIVELKKLMKAQEIKKLVYKIYFILETEAIVLRVEMFALYTIRIKSQLF